MRFSNFGSNETVLLLNLLKSLNFIISDQAEGAETFSTNVNSH